MEKLSTGEAKVSSMEVTGEELAGLYGDVYIRELAFWSCINIVANAVCKCTFRTFQGGKEVQGPEWYLWNVEPNQNQNADGFLHKLISRLYRDNEALIVEEGNRLLVADSFSRKPSTLYEDVFSQVRIEDFTFARSFRQSEVLYFKLTEQDMRRVTAGLYDAYSKLIDYGMRAYRRSRGSRGVVNIDTLKNPQWEENFKKLEQRYFKEFYNSDNAVLPMFGGYEYVDMSGNKTYSNETTRDIRAMIDDISDFTAKGFGVPPALLRGDVEGTKDALDSLLTFCIDPLCGMLSKEINRKRYGMEGLMRGDYLHIDTKGIRHVELFQSADLIDKLVASGCFSVNDIRRAMGEPPIPEEWAGRYFMTKNYATVEEMLHSLAAKGGETK